MKIIAHRGLHTQHQENSLDAFRAAIAHPGFDGVECDVWRCKSGELVLSHNSRIHRQGQQIQNLTFNQLSKSDIARLSDLYELIAPTNKELHIELKQVGLIPQVKELLLDKRNVRLLIRHKEDIQPAIELLTKDAVLVVHPIYLYARYRYPKLKIVTRLSWWNMAIWPSVAIGAYAAQSIREINWCDRHNVSYVYSDFVPVNQY